MYFVTPEAKLVPKLFIVIVGNTDEATKEYQTSAPGVPLQELVTDGLEAVAYAKVPVVGVHIVEEAANVIAAEQASFDGGPGSVRQILNSPFDAGIALVPYILIK
jgi:hypothetical protein